MTRSIDDYLRDMADSVEKILKFTEGMAFEDFEGDEKTIFAVVRAFEIIGEAARNIPDEIQRHYPNVEWKEMSRMRNKLIHEYFGADVSILWETVHNDVPRLRDQMRPIIAALSSQ